MNFLRAFLSTRKRVRQRATRYSLLVVILLFGLFLEAYMHNFNLVYITLFFVFAAAFAAGPLGVMNLGKIETAFQGCSRLFARREGYCRFEIVNTGDSPAWGLELRSADAFAELPAVMPRTPLRAALALTPKRRGRMTLSDCRIESLFPLATVRFVLPVKASCETIVYPEPKGEPLHSFLLRERAPFGDETDFDGLARYSGSENASRIHWPSVAKGEISVKTFEHETRSDTLRFDFYRCGPDDETRLSQLTLWVLECEEAKVPFSVIMPGRTLHYPKEEIDAVLTYLALY